MSKKRFWTVTAILVLLAVFIRLFRAGSDRVEASYSNGIYPLFGSFFRTIFGWIPFSIGDILYGLAVAWLLWRIIKGIIALFRRRVTKISFVNGLKKAVIILLSVYVVFYLFWGINYSRKGIDGQLGIQRDTFSYSELKQVTMMLVQRMNSTKQYLVDNKVEYPSSRQLFERVSAAYKKASEVYPFLAYPHTAIKPSIWGWIGNYTGFTGYYNPFTGEAQINTFVPKFAQPFVACHEVGHQVGYAKEDEASAAGYLAARYSGDSLLLYSTYFDLYSSARRELLYRAFVKQDTSILKEISTLLIPEVKADIREMTAYFSRHKNAVEPFIRRGYAFYLKNNNQPKGMQSYDEVTAFLIAYYRKFKTI